MASSTEQEVKKTPTAKPREYPPGARNYFLSMLNDPSHSDFTIESHGKAFYVHKVFICKNKYLEAASNPDKFKEGQQKKLVVKEASQIAVWASLSFLYCGSYLNVMKKGGQEPEDIFTHADVYLLADLWDVHGLRELACRNIWGWTFKWTSKCPKEAVPIVMQAAKKVFDSTPNPATHVTIRGMFIYWIKHNADIVFENNDTGNQSLRIFESSPSLVAEVARSTACAIKGLPKYSEQANSINFSLGLERFKRLKNEINQFMESIDDNKIFSCE